MLRFLLQPLLEVFFPRSCVHCGDCVEETDLSFLCAPCQRELFIVGEPACRICGHPFYGHIEGAFSCSHCAELAPNFDEGKALMLTKGAARSIIHALKYNRGHFVLQDLAKLVRGSASFASYFSGSVLVPVPLHPTKLRQREFNQSLAIAEMLQRETQAIRVEELLIRQKFTQTQTNLTRIERIRNVKGAFALRPRVEIQKDTPYILVDDVFTTGSTLNACAQVLRDSGAISVKVATIGHG